MMPKSVLVTLVPRVRWQLSDGTGGAGWPAPDGSPLVLAVPGEAVALHWLDLPDLAPAQAAAAARMTLADRLAEAAPHITVAPGSGPRPVAAAARAPLAGRPAGPPPARRDATPLLPASLLHPPATSRMGAAAG